MNRRKKLIGVVMLLMTAFHGVAQLLGDDLNRFEFAKDQYRNGKFALCVDYCNQLVDRGVRNADLYALRAVSYRHLGDYQKAAADFSEAIQRSWNDPYLYMSRGNVFVCLKDLDKAKTDFNEANRLFHNQQKKNHFVLEERGRVLLGLGNYSDAMFDFQTAIDYGSLTAYIDILTAQFRSKQWADLQVYANTLLQKTTAGTQNLLSDSSLFYYVMALRELSGRSSAQGALDYVERAIRFYRPVQNNCQQGLYHDMQVARAFALTTLGQDSLAYEQYKTLASASPGQKDLFVALEGLKIKIGIDVTPPVITIINPMVNAGGLAVVNTTGSSVDLYGKITDSSGIASLYVNNRSVSRIEDDGLFVVPLTLQSGRNDVSVVAVDRYDNRQEFRFQLTASVSQEGLSLNIDSIPEISSDIAYHAILIGEKDYMDNGFADLETPVTDVKELRELLVKHYDFQERNVMVLTNARGDDILDSVERKASTLTENDNLIIFYAGHGDVQRVGGRVVGGYLVPSDAKKGSRNTYISATALKDAIRFSSAKHILFVMDACFSGALFRSSMDDANVNIKTQYMNNSRRFLTSANVEETPDKGKFIQNLKFFLRNNKEKYVSANDVYQFLLKNAEQTLPQYDRIEDVGSLGGHFIFTRK